MASPPYSSWQDVRIWGIQDRRKDERAQKPWVVRWRVDARSRGRTFRTRSEAEAFRSELLLAKRLNEHFDPETCEPASWNADPRGESIHSWARRWVAEQWDEWQPRTRTSAIEALARFVPIVCAAADAPKAPDDIRKHLTATLRPDAPINPDSASESWLNQYARTIDSLDRVVLAQADSALARGLDGKQLSASTAGRYRKIARACVRRAAELHLIDSDPWPPSPRGRARRKSARKARVDTRRLPDPQTMRAAIDKIQTHQPGSRNYKVMTAVAYYGGLRPSEVVMLRPRALTLPAKGFGNIDVSESDIDFDEPGEPKTGPRDVPIPPELVVMLRDFVTERGAGADDLLFRTRSGKRPTASNWGRAWHRALDAVGHQRLRVYDCRHAAATTWLNAGVPFGEVARRLGHSVETLVSTYVGVSDADQQIANKRIAAALAEGIATTKRRRLRSTSTVVRGAWADIGEDPQSMQGPDRSGAAST